MQGKLFIIATPIGNLGDMSPRAMETMRSVDLLACESTQAARRLCSALQIPCPRLVLYREDSSDSVQDKLLEQIKDGASCGLISDAGTPGISDPGWKLVSGCHTEGIPVISLAGPSSLAAAISAAGQPTRRFFFGGFPPNKKAERRAFLQEMLEQTVSTVFFETPHQILETLRFLGEHGPQRSLSICRELTKLHETNQKRPLSEWLADPPPARGEFVLMLEGAPPAFVDPQEHQAEGQAEFLLRAGLSAGQTRDFLESFANLPRNQAYRLVLELQQKIHSKPD